MTVLLMHLGGEWIRLDGGSAEKLPDYPKVLEAALVVSDFGADMQTGTIELEGNPVHAPFLINRRLTAEGTMDGESRALIHVIEKTRRGYMACYSAIALTSWRKLEDWGRAQRRVCLTVPLTSLLWRQVTPSRGVVAQSGRSLFFLARIDKRTVYCSTLAFSEAPGDMEMAARSLGERVKMEWSVISGLPEEFTVVWQTVFARVGEGEATQSRELAARFFAEATVTGTVLPSQVYGLPTHRIETSLPTLLDARSFLASVNPFSQRASWALEQWAPLWSAAFLAGALLSVFYAGVFLVNAQGISVEADRIQAQAQQFQRQAQAIRPDTLVPAGYDMWSQQVAAQFATLQGFDVNQIVGMVGAAARTSGVRVLRIYTAELSYKDLPSGAGRSNKTEKTDKSVVIDGAFPAGGDGAHGGQLAKFVDLLRVSGFSATPVDTAAGHLDGNLLAQVFTYRLTAIGTSGQVKK